MDAQQFGLVSQQQPLVVDSKDVQPRGNCDNVYRDLTKIYESYAEMYPNPRLVEEARERDTLIQASSAASHARSQVQASSRKGGFFSFLFGGANEDPTPSVDDITEDADSPDSPIMYIEPNLDDADDQICGTSVGLDVSCVPEEAHSVARFHMASTKTKRGVPNMSRTRVDEPPGAGFHIIVGLGEIAETKDDGTSQLLETTDKQDLLRFSASTTPFQLEYARAASLGFNCIAISWGFTDGIVVLYRRIQLDDHEALEPITFMGPPQAVIDNLAGVGGTLIDDGDFSGSPLIRVTDIVPLTVECLPMDDVMHPSIFCTLTVSRLGGYMELIPLPTPAVYGDILTPETYRPPKRPKRKRAPHYAVGVLRDDMVTGTVALTTAEYHADIICLTVLRTTVTEETIWNIEDYPDGPPSEFVLAACGSGESGHAIVTFWSIGTILKRDTRYVESKHGPYQPMFQLHASLIEAITTPTGADASVFATSKIARRWRVPRQVQLRPVAVDSESSKVKSHAFKSTKVSSITTTSPIVGMEFLARSQFGEERRKPMLALLDWNGGVTLLDCSVLDGVASQNLASKEYDLFKTHDENVSFPLVVTVISRNRCSHFFSSHTAGRPPSILGISWYSGQENGETSPGIVCLNLSPKKVLMCSLLEILASQNTGDKSLEGRQEKVQFLRLPANASAVIRSRRSGVSFVAYQLVGHAGKACVRKLDLQQLVPIAIVHSLARSSRYMEAIQSASQLSLEEKVEAGPVVQHCHMELWKTEGSISSLRQCGNTSYILQQAIETLHGISGKKIDISDMHEVALMVHQLRVETNEEQTQKDEVQELMVKLGTYQLLCQMYGVAQQAEHFQTDFSRQNISDLAIYFAKTGDVLALSLIMFRHRQDLDATIHILSSLPVSTDPKEYCHLVPVVSDIALTDTFAPEISDQCQPMHISQLPQHLYQLSDLAVVVDASDEKMILESRQHSNCQLNPTYDDIVCKIGNWIISRASDERLFVGCDQFASELCQLGKQCLKGVVNSNNIHMQATADMIENIAKMSAEIASLQGVVEMGITDSHESVVESHISLLDATTTLSRDTPDFVEMTLRSAQSSSADPADCNKHLLPLLKKFLHKGSNIVGDDTDGALEAYCRDLYTQCQNVWRTVGHDSLVLIEKAKHALLVCSWIICGSSVHVMKQNRLIKNKKVLTQIALQTISDFSSMLAELSISSADAENFVGIFWKIFEALPRTLPVSLSTDEQWKALMTELASTYRGLVGLDIMSKWPDCNGFNFFGNIRNNENEPSIAGGSLECGIKDLSRSFLAQMDHFLMSGNIMGLSSLLDDLLSDADQLQTILATFVGQIDWQVDFLCSHLLRKLLEAERFGIILVIVKHFRANRMDMNSVNVLIKHYMREAIYEGDPGDQGGAQAALMCHDTLSPELVDLRDDFALFKCHLDVSHYIHTSLLLNNDTGDGSFTPANIISAASLDIINAVLIRCPEYCLIGNEWQDENVAHDSNAYLREKATLSTQLADHSFQDQAFNSIPGEGVTLLCKLFGLDDEVPLLVTRVLVTGLLLSKEKYGAAAAVCRSLISAQEIWTPQSYPQIVAQMGIIVNTICASAYDDVATKLELTKSLLLKNELRVSPVDVDASRLLTSTCAKLVYRKSPFNTEMNGSTLLPDRPISRLYHHCQVHYNSDIHALFNDLCIQASKGDVHDALMNSLSKLVMFWCISESFRPKHIINCPEKSDLDEVLALATSLMMHIPSKQTSKGCTQELNDTLYMEKTKVSSLKRFSQKLTRVVPNEKFIQELLSRGYSEDGARRSIMETGGHTFEAALGWAINHTMDADFNDPLTFMRPSDDHFIDDEALGNLQAVLAYVDVDTPKPQQNGSANKDVGNMQTRSTSEASREKVVLHTAAMNTLPHDALAPLHSVSTGILADKAGTNMNDPQEVSARQSKNPSSTTTASRGVKASGVLLRTKLPASAPSQPPVQIQPQSPVQARRHASAVAVRSDEQSNSSSSSSSRPTTKIPDRPPLPVPPRRTVQDRLGKSDGQGDKVSPTPKAVSRSLPARPPTSRIAGIAKPPGRPPPPAGKLVMPFKLSKSTANKKEPGVPLSREELKERGKRLLEEKKKASSPDKNRQRLLAEGRQLLQKSRGAGGAPAVTSAAVKATSADPLILPARRPAHGRTAPTAQKLVVRKLPVSPTPNLAHQADLGSGWDFDDLGPKANGSQAPASSVTPIDPPTKLQPVRKIPKKPTVQPLPVSKVSDDADAAWDFDDFDNF